MTLGDIGPGHPADQKVGETPRLKVGQPGANFIRETMADQVGGDLAVQNPAHRVTIFQCFGQQIVHLEHFDITLTHLGHEVEVITLRLIGPEHIIE